MSQKDNEITKKIQAGIDPEDLDEELEKELEEQEKEWKEYQRKKEESK